MTFVARKRKDPMNFHALALGAMIMAGSTVHLLGQTASEAAPSPTRKNSLGMCFAEAGTRGLLVSIWETRVQDFQMFIDNAGYQVEGQMASLGKNGGEYSGATWKAPGFSQGPTHPVVGVSWDDATAFCRWLTEKERKAGLLVPGEVYRLPTAAEWGRAVGDVPVYYWGPEWPPPAGAGNFCGEEALGENWPQGWTVIPGYNDGFARTAPVGTYRPNLFGLYDMEGNVREWCHDWYRKDMNLPSALARHPAMANDRGGAALRVIRGASWLNLDPAILNSAFHYARAPNSRWDTVGFRVVLGHEIDH